MKKLLKNPVYLLLVALSVSCSTDEPEEKKETVDPVNGVSDYLLEKAVVSTAGGSSTTTYAYDENGVVISDALRVFPANLNSSSEPYVIKEGNQKLFCDSKKRVVKEEIEGYQTFYEYDGQDRISRKILLNLAANRRDTTEYTYFVPGENNFEGASFQAKTPVYTTNTTHFERYKYENYYFSPAIKLKSWVTYPYNYGKIQDAPLVRYTYTTVNRSLRQESFTPELNEQGLIVKTVHNYLGGSSEYTYSYIKR